jgi:hypothetical protein
MVTDRAEYAPRVHVYEYPKPLKLNEPVHLRLCSDLHVEAQFCAHKKLQRDLRELSQMENPVVASVGDTLNGIWWQDPLRYAAHVLVPELLANDDYQDRMLDFASEQLTRYSVPWAFIGTGNHEENIKRRAGTDLVARLAHRCNTRAAGYWGLFKLRLRVSGKQTDLRILWHHGAWGGAYMRGLGGAQRWALRYAGMKPHVIAYGHNHFESTHWEHDHYEHRGAITAVKRAWVVTGCYLRSDLIDDPKAVGYATLKGLPPSPVGSPIIRAWVQPMRKLRSDRGSRPVLRFEVIGEGGVEARYPHELD